MRYLDTIVQSAGMSADVDRAWALEIDRRRVDYLAGRIQLVEGEEVFRKAMSNGQLPIPSVFPATGVNG